MSPLKIEILLRYYVNSGTTDARFWTSGAPIVEQTFRELCDEGLLFDKSAAKPEVAFPARFAATDKLKAYVGMLTETPLPESAWIDPRTNGFVKRSA